MPVTYSAGFIKLDDDQEIYLGHVAEVSNSVGSNGGQFYEVILSGGHHESIKEVDYPRATFIEKWKNTMNTINGVVT